LAGINEERDVAEVFYMSKTNRTKFIYTLDINFINRRASNAFYYGFGSNV